MFASKDIGIDLGTANTLVYLQGKGVITREPSVVSVNKRTGKILAVGGEAKDMLGKTPGSIEAYKPLRDGVIADFEITAEMLKHFIRKARKGRKSKVVVCVPYGVTDVERRAVNDAIEQTGIRSSWLIEEPVAAAIGAGLPVSSPTGCMVVDIGGGTSEVAVISLNGIVTSTSVRVAGNKFDEAIVAYVRRKHNTLIGEASAETLKKEIGAVHPAMENKTMEVRGRNLLTGLPQTLEIDSVQVIEALEDCVFEIVESIKHTLEETPPELSSDIYERGITLTGGGAYLRGLDLLLSEQTGVPVTIADRALDCVIMGIGAVLENPEEYGSVLTNYRKQIY